MTRGNNFDALRLLGALAVLVSHQFMVMGQEQPAAGTYTLGTMAVFMFFAISGFLVAGSWKSDPDGPRFVARRTLRMLPGWVALMVITWLAQSSTGIVQFEDNPEPYFNGSLWTLQWEILCYAAMGVLAIIVPLRTAAPAAIVVILMLLASGKFPGYSSPLECCLMFWMGVLIRSYPQLFKVIPVALIAGTVVGLLMWESWRYALLLAVPMLSVFIGTASTAGLRRAGRFGDFSYGIYIYAFPVQQFGVLLWGKETPYLTLLAVSLLVTGALAVLSWHFVEKPGLALKPRSTRALPPLQTTAVLEPTAQPPI